jgi:protease stability complex PrcB-like protein
MDVQRLFGQGEVDMRHGGFWTACALALTALGCGSTMEPDAPGNPVPVPVERLESRPTALTDSSGLTQPGIQVVRDAATWAQVWNAIWRGSPPPLPAADFAREILVVAALGERPSSGYTILVDSAEATGDGLRVMYRTIAPGSGCVVATVMTQPVDVARIARTDPVVFFVQRPEVHECR